MTSDPHVFDRKPSWILACGGTGGHLFPGIALYQSYERAGLLPVLAVSHKAIDQTILENYPGYRFVRMKGVLWRGNILKRGIALMGLCMRTLEAGIWIFKNKPVGVVGFGGFSMVPWVLAAFLLRKKIILHEANGVPGKATYWLARLADCVYVPYPKALEAKNVRVLGLPLRDGFERHDSKEARQAFDLPDYGKVLLVMGGSQGARALNDWVCQYFPRLAQLGWHVVLLTGNAEDEQGATINGMDDRPYTLCVRSFENRMALLLSAVDFAIARSGAGTIAEFIRLQIPSILVPYPHAAADHQTVNAQWLTELGGGEWLSQNQLNILWDRFYNASQEASCQRMKAALALLGSTDPRLELVRVAQAYNFTSCQTSCA